MELSKAAEPTAYSPIRALRGRDSASLILFSGSLLLSALLLFSVQPLFAKMVLPRLGGTPAVWSVAMVFFQAMLLAGYAYAYLLVRYAPGWRGVGIHAATMVAALFWLPLGIMPGFERPPTDHLPLWLLGLFAASLGAPFFAVAANAPLLQAWFARTGHPHAADPYFLYGASNVGSLLALLSYPLLWEPLLPLSEQARLWTAGYLALAVAVLGCGLSAAARPAQANPKLPPAPAAASPNPPNTERLRWIGYAFLPSALLVATTAHVSTNIAAAPFLWVAPLAVFLLTFILAFQRRPVVSHRAMQRILPFAVAAVALTYIGPGYVDGIAGIAITMFALFVIAMTWHGELVAYRPAASRLTGFYLCMSLGGVLGGAFASLAAPVLFNELIEYPLLLCVALFAAPDVRRLARRPVGMLAGAAAVLALVLAGWFSAVEYQDRSFFGVIRTVTTNDGRIRALIHGTTVHGAERISDLSSKERPQPLTYYARGGPLADGLKLARTHAQGGGLAVGVVGLGTGSLACYAEGGDDWRFYEIDPAVIRVARDPSAFTFLSACAPDAPIIQGDARLSLAGQQPGALDVLVIDAFSSDAIPVHLLTREALRLYAEQVGRDGVVLLHISNRFMELRSVVASTAAAEGLSGAWRLHRRSAEDESERLWTSSEVVVLSRDPGRLNAYLESGWSRLLPDLDRPVAPWTDDYSNIIAPILRHKGLL